MESFDSSFPRLWMFARHLKRRAWSRCLGTGSSGRLGTFAAHGCNRSALQALGRTTRANLFCILGGTTLGSGVCTLPISIFFFWKIWSQNGCHCISASNKCLQISSTPGVQRDFKSFLNKCNWPQSDAITHPALLFFLDFFFFEDELDDPDELPLLLLLLPSLPWNQRLIQSSSTSSVASVSRTQNCRPAWQSNMHAWFSAGPPNCFSSGHVNLYFRVPWFYLRFDFPAAM